MLEIIYCKIILVLFNYKLWHVFYGQNDMTTLQSVALGLYIVVITWARTTLKCVIIHEIEKTIL